jgi:2-C-methyl-D-erythritol 4-phosphate cytidylyltransferase
LFLNRDAITQIQLLVLPEMLDEVKRKQGPHFGFSGVKIVAGGPRWADQLAAAAGTISPEATHVIVHDAARPIVPYSDIDALLEEGPKHTAAALMTPTRSMLVEIDEGGNAVGYHSAARFMQLLTPHVYAKEAFAEMAGSKQEIHASKLTLLKGSPLNVRISGPGEASMAKSMLAMLPKPKMKARDNPFEEAQW